MESNITNKVSEDIQSSVPILITESLKQQLPGMLTDALQTIIPAVLKDLKKSVKTSVEENLPAFNEQSQQNVKAQIPELFIKPLNKELNAFNKLQANKFTTAEGEKDKEKPDEVNNQEKQRNEKPKSKDANIPRELNAEKANIETAMIVYSSERKGSEEKTTDESDSNDKDDQPIAKRLKRKGKEIATVKELIKQLIPFLEQSGSDPKALNLHQFSESGKKITLEEALE
ncbi:hypothetical protein Tco_0494215 [Tanacetum coccineum]